MTSFKMISIAMVFGIFKLLRRHFCIMKIVIFDRMNRSIIEIFSFNVLFNQTGCIYRLLVSNMHYNNITQESI